MTTAEALALAVLDGTVDEVIKTEAYEVHDSLVGFAKGYEDSREYKFIEAYRNGDPRISDFARRLCGKVEASPQFEDSEEIKEERTGQLRLDI